MGEALPASQHVNGSSEARAVQLFPQEARSVFLLESSSPLCWSWRPFPGAPGSSCSVSPRLPVRGEPPSEAGPHVSQGLASCVDRPPFGVFLCDVSATFCSEAASLSSALCQPGSRETRVWVGWRQPHQCVCPPRSESMGIPNQGQRRALCVTGR